MHPSRLSFPRSTRGSVLIVAMLMAAIIGISLVSFIKLSDNSLKQAHRTFYSNSAMNLAEVGLEEAISRFNALDNSATPADAWPSPWTLNNTAYNSSSSPYTPCATNNFTGFTVGPNTTGSVKVWVHYYNGQAGATPKIVAKSTITQPDGSPPISKYIEVTLRKRSLFSNGLVARENVSWVGHPLADSWDSKADTQPTTAIPYDDSIRTANVIVGSISGNIGLGGGEVWGYAKTGEFGVISGGSVHPLGTTTDDPTRRTNDFNATFPEPTVPNPTTFNTISSDVSNNTTWPITSGGGAHTPTTVAGETVYYYKFDSSADISLNSKTLTISPGYKVVFLMNNHTGSSAISVSGNGAISLGLGSTMNVYTNGNISIAGNGENMANDNASPQNAIIWSTATASDSQSITVSGNGQLKACVYAPNASVSLNGGGTDGLMCGSVVAKSITMNGGTEFHYDDALGRLTTGNPYGISKWRELQSATERAAYAVPLAY